MQAKVTRNQGSSIAQEPQIQIMKYAFFIGLSLLAVLSGGCASHYGPNSPDYSPLDDILFTQNSPPAIFEHLGTAPDAPGVVTSAQSLPELGEAGGSPCFSNDDTGASGKMGAAGFETRRLCSCASLLKEWPPAGAHP